MNEFFKKPVVKILMLKGEKGDKGNTGTGTPTGGKTGQYLLKKSDADYDYQWSAITTVNWESVTGKPDAYPTTWDNVSGKTNATASASGLMSAADKSKLDNLHVGGRNYLLNSDIKITGDGEKSFNVSDINSLNHNLGKSIVISFRYDAENWTGIRFGFETGFQYADGTSNIYGIWINGSANGNETAISVVGLPTEKGKITSISYCGLYVQGTSAGTVTVYKPKVELGNVATDWTPAPEDVDSKIDALNSVTKYLTLSASGWQWSVDHWWGSLSDHLITATSNQEIIPSTTITADQLKALQKANIICGGQEEGKLYLRVFGTKPTIDIPIMVIFRGTI